MFSNDSERLHKHLYSRRVEGNSREPHIKYSITAQVISNNHEKNQQREPPPHLAKEPQLCQRRHRPVRMVRLVMGPVLGYQAAELGLGEEMTQFLLKL